MAPCCETQVESCAAEPISSAKASFTEFGFGGGGGVRSLGCCPCKPEQSC